MEDTLSGDEIFVFGSNEAGRHGKGAAKVAYERYGAQYGRGVGLFGQSYAIPTKNAKLQTLPTPTIKKYIDDFLIVVAQNKHKTFYVTEIGCGLAGYTPQEIAPLFTRTFPNMALPKRFWEVLDNLTK